MEDIVAIRVTLSSREKRYFLTWGRIFDAVDPQPLLATVRDNLYRFDLGGSPVTIELCPTLQDASRAPYFFEAFFSMSHHPIPRGAGYAAWRRRIRDGFAAGKELHYLGRITWRVSATGRLKVAGKDATVKARRSLGKKAH